MPLRPVLLKPSYNKKYAILISCRLDFLYLAQTWHKLAYFPAYEPFHPSAQGKYCPMSHFRNIKVHVRSLVQLCPCRDVVIHHQLVQLFFPVHGVQRA